MLTKKYQIEMVPLGSQSEMRNAKRWSAEYLRQVHVHVHLREVFTAASPTTCHPLVQQAPGRLLSLRQKVTGTGVMHMTSSCYTLV